MESPVAGDSIARHNVAGTDTRKRRLIKGNPMVHEIHEKHEKSQKIKRQKEKTTRLLQLNSFVLFVGFVDKCF